MSNLQNLINRQAEFQRLCGLNIDSEDPDEINQLAEMYCYKALDEIVELRKTQPSVLNKYSKNQTNDRIKMMGELSDVLLFLINYTIVKKIDPEELFIFLQETQKNNFRLLYNKLGTKASKRLI